MVVSKAECAAAKAETEATLVQMKSVVVDVTLYARAKLMEEFKVEQHADWNPDYEIGDWKAREAVLAKVGQVEEEEVTIEG